MQRRNPWLPGLAFLACATAALAIDVPLTYVKHTDDNAPSQGGGFQPLVLGTKAPADVKLPALSAEGPHYYATASLGGTPRCFVFTRKSGKDAPPCSRIYFDADGTRDLTGAKPLDALDTADAAATPAGFPPIAIDVPAGTAKIPYSFTVQVFPSEPDPEKKDAPPFEAFLVANCSYTGTFALDGKSYTVTLGDGNANGTFTDKIARVPAASADDAAEATSADFFWLASGDEERYMEPPQLCDLLVIGAKTFRVTPAVAEKKLVLAPVTTGLADATLPAGLGLLTLYPAARGESALLYAPASAVKLPAGAYRFTRYDLVRKDAQGDTWMLQAEATKGSPAIVLAAGATAAALFGEPFVSNVDLRATREKSSSFFGLLDGPVKNVLRLNLKLEGAAKERVTMVAHVDGKNTKLPLDRTARKPKEPQYRISSTGGETLNEGVFTYG
jgi:hypothetical protein